MTKPRAAGADVSMPALLRHARLAYSAAMRTVLNAAGYDDIPKNGLYVIGGLAREVGAHPLGQLIADLRLSKQAAGQLVDVLVTRGYLKREVDSEDRRRLTLRLTERGRAAAKVLSTAGVGVDDELMSHFGPKDIERARRVLFALVDMGRRTTARTASDDRQVGSIRTKLTNTREILHVRGADLTDSRFSESKLVKAQFNDVNLQESAFTNTNLAGARFLDVNLAGATIQDANLTDMTVNGKLVTDLVRAFGSRARMVLYVKGIAIMRDFYQGVFALKVEHSEPDHVVLGTSASQLVIVQVPASIASTIHIADPPVRRTQTPVKLVFDVESISAARSAVLKLGGSVDPREREWVFQGHRVCDGHDPEGNVVQFRQRDRQPGAS